MTSQVARGGMGDTIVDATIRLPRCLSSISLREVGTAQPALDMLAKCVFNNPRLSSGLGFDNSGSQCESSLMTNFKA